MSGSPSFTLRLSDLLDETFRVYRRNISVLILITLLVQAPLALFSTLIRMMSDSTNGAMLGSDSGLTLIGGMFRSLQLVSSSSEWGLLYDAVLHPLLAGALICAVMQSYRKEPISIGPNFRISVSYLMAFIGSGILRGLILIVMMVPAFICMAVGISSLVWPQVNAGILQGTTAFGAGSMPVMMVAVVAVTLIMLLPMAYVGLRLGLTQQIILLEQRRAVDSIGRSWDLTAGTSWRLLVFGLVVMLAEIVITRVPAAFLVQLITMLQVSDQTMLLATTVVQLIAATIATPFTILAYTVLYLDLRVRRDGLDLERQIQMGAAQAQVAGA